MDAMTDEFHDEASYGALLADEYDAIYGDVFDTEGAVDQLARLADGGRILEFGVGTGRIALPLAEKGLDVWGVDGSAEMLKILEEKPGGDKVTTLCGDFAYHRRRGQVRPRRALGQHDLRHGLPAGPDRMLRECSPASDSRRAVRH